MVALLTEMFNADSEPRDDPPETVKPVVVALPVEIFPKVDRPVTLRVPERTEFWVTAKAWVTVALVMLDKHEDKITINLENLKNLRNKLSNELLKGELRLD